MAQNNTVYADPRLQKLEEEKQAALQENRQHYDTVLGQLESQYDGQLQAAQDWKEVQTQQQQMQTQAALEQLRQQQETAKTDYTRQQQGAYADWKTQSGSYGIQAEKLAAGGLAGTGYSESTQAGFYNAYQNRLSAARQGYEQAVRSFESAMQQAKQQGSTAMAQIAYQSLQQQMQIAMQALEEKNRLLEDRAEQDRKIGSVYYDRNLDVLSQINQEKALEEKQRQYDAEMAEQQRQYDAEMAEQQRQYDAKLAQSKELLALQALVEDLKAQIVSGPGAAGSTVKPPDGSYKTEILDNLRQDLNTYDPKQEPDAPSKWTGGFPLGYNAVVKQVLEFQQDGAKEETLRRYVREAQKAGSITKEEADRMIKMYIKSTAAKPSGLPDSTLVSKPSLPGKGEPGNAFQLRQ